MSAATSAATIVPPAEVIWNPSRWNAPGAARPSRTKISQPRA